MEPELKTIRWEEYFKKLLNPEVPVSPTLGTTFQKAEPMLNEVTQEETDKAVDSLKNWKAPGSDSIPSELIKYGGKQLHYAMFKICQTIRKDENVPTIWNESIIIPLHKKGDKTDCENYKGILLLNSAYKIFSKTRTLCGRESRRMPVRVSEREINDNAFVINWPNHREKARIQVKYLAAIC